MKYKVGDRLIAKNTKAKYDIIEVVDDIGYVGIYENLPQHGPTRLRLGKTFIEEMFLLREKGIKEKRSEQLKRLFDV